MPGISRRTLLASLPTVAAAGGSASAQPKKITLAYGMQGGNFEIYSVAFIDALRSVDPVFEIRGLLTKGIQDNVARLEAGTVDIGLVFGEMVHELFMGVGRPPTKLRIISVMYSTPGMFVVRADSRYRSINDLKGHRVVWNGRNGGLAIQARYVMDGLGLDPDRDFEAVYTERLQDGPYMVIEGEAAALWGGGKRWPGFVTVATSSRGARFIVPSRDEIVRIQEKYPFLAKIVVPAGLYPGQYDPITTVGAWSFILARADLDDAIGFRLAQALHRAERTSQLSKQLSESTAKNTITAVPDTAWLHPGVLQYYKKAGLLP